MGWIVIHGLQRIIHINCGDPRPFIDRTVKISIGPYIGL